MTVGVRARFRKREEKGGGGGRAAPGMGNV
jgi:hypothetical protein